jgi:hypothetical protein
MKKEKRKSKKVGESRVFIGKGEGVELGPLSHVCGCLCLMSGNESMQF